MAEEEKSQPQTENVQVRIPDNIGHGAYANIISVHANDNEVILDFVLNSPGGGSAILTSRVIITPSVAQKLSDILEAVLRTQKEKSKKV